MRQSFSYTLLITWVLIAVSCKTQNVQKSYETLNISVSNDEYSLDSSVVQLYLPFKEVLEEDMNRVISVSMVEMKKDKPESLLTNFLGDLLLAEGLKEAKKKGLNVIPSVSYFNYGGIRTSLPKGEITVGKIFELMPFENEMVFLKLKGNQMQEFLNYVAAKGGDGLGGVRLLISEGKATNVEINGESLKAEKDYWLVTNDYVANGGDGLKVLTESSEFIKSGTKIRESIISYLEDIRNKDEVLTGQLDGRIANETSIE